MQNNGNNYLLAIERESHVLAHGKCFLCIAVRSPQSGIIRSCDSPIFGWTQLPAAGVETADLLLLNHHLVAITNIPVTFPHTIHAPVDPVGSHVGGRPPLLPPPACFAVELGVAGSLYIVVNKVNCCNWVVPIGILADVPAASAIAACMLFIGSAALHCNWFISFFHHIEQVIRAYGRGAIILCCAIAFPPFPPSTLCLIQEAEDLMLVWVARHRSLPTQAGERPACPFIFPPHTWVEAAHRVPSKL